MERWLEFTKREHGEGRWSGGVGEARKTGWGLAGPLPAHRILSVFSGGLLSAVAFTAWWVVMLFRNLHFSHFLRASRHVARASWLLLLPLGPGLQGLQQSLPTGAHVFSLLSGPRSGNRAPFPPGTSEPASQASGACLHPRRLRKSRASRGCDRYGLPPARRIYMGTWVLLAVPAAALAGRRSPAPTPGTRP